MIRTIEAEKEYKTSDVSKAISKFFKAFPELDYWKEELEYMAENNIDFECNDTFGDGSKNNEWSYALHLDNDDCHTYICIIERA